MTKYFITYHKTITSNPNTNKYIFLFILFLLAGCITPEEPKYEYKEGLIYIDAFASTNAGTSYVNLSKSTLQLEAFINEFISGATVQFRNTDTDQFVTLIETNDIYLPPDDFVVAAGETWSLEIELEDGTQYHSQSEIVLPSTTGSNIKATYNPEIQYNTDLNKFVAGHSISTDVTDPQNEKNFYLFKYRSYEKITYCEICPNQFFRDGKCKNVDIGPNIGSSSDFGDSYYYCDGECWRIRYNENIKIFSDEFATGGTITNVAGGATLLYTNENILLELQQLSITEEAYEYYKVIVDITDNNSGLNAPPPAALIGNVYNPSNAEEYVLGRFTAASSSSQTLFINRSTIAESTIEHSGNFNSECNLVCGPTECINNSSSCTYITTAPCSETHYRTGIKPTGWID